MVLTKQDSPPALAIQLLGTFRVLVRGKAVQDSQWARPQAKLVLKLLALEPKHQLHHHQIIDAIWPNLDAVSGLANLHKIIHMARRALEPKLTSAAKSRFIQTHEQQVRLTSPDRLWIDVEQFEAKSIVAFRSGKVPDCEEALSLYSGDLLSGDLYADWCNRRRDQLQALHQELLMKLGTIYAETGQHKPAIAQFEKVVAAQPSNEEAHRELMQLYALTGRRSEALRQFRRCSDAVRLELDAEPEETTGQLYRKILAREIRPVPAAAQEEHNAGVSIDTIAILPFHNDTGESSLAYLSSGIAESLIKNLRRLPRLRVLAYSAVDRYRGRDLNPRRLGRTLMVGAVVMGRVVQIDGGLTVTAELVNTSDGSVLWSEQYLSRQTNLLAIQDEISREISGKLKLRITVEERKRLAKRYTTDPDAYTMYLRGRFHWNKRTADGLRTAIGHFESAIEKDPGYALAYSGLADCYNLLSLYSAMPPKQAMPKAKSAALRALKIDESVAEAHTSLAYVYLYYDWNWSAAEREFERAIELNPNYATAHHWYHEYLTAMGRFEDQMAEILHAEELDPMSLIINTDIGWGLYYARKYDEAIEQLRRTLELDANFAVAHLMLGLAQTQKKSFDEALTSIQRAIELSAKDPFALAIGALGYVFAVSGRPSDARAVLGKLKHSTMRYAADYCQALVFTGLGDHASALKNLKSAVEQRHDRLIYLKVEPIFDVLRDDPKFQSLIRRIGL